MKKFFTFFAAAAMTLAAMATEYEGVITIDNGLGDTIINNASIILIEDNDSVSFIIHNLRIHDNDQYLNVGNVYISNSKIFNLRGIKAIANEANFVVTEGDITLPDNQIWASIAFPPSKYVVSSLYDEEDLILRFQFFTYQPDVTFTIQFSTPHSNAPIIKGDVNRDGYVTSADVQAVYNIMFNQ